MQIRNLALGLALMTGALLAACTPAAPLVPPTSPPTQINTPPATTAPSPEVQAPPELLYLTPDGEVIAQPAKGEPRSLARLPDAGRALDAIAARGKLYVLAERAVLEVDPASGATRPLASLDPPALFGRLLPLGGEMLLYSISIDAWQEAGLGLVDAASGAQRYLPGETGYLQPIGVESWNGNLIVVPLSGDPEFPEFASFDLNRGEFTGGWPTSDPPGEEFGHEYAAISPDGRFLAFSSVRVISADQPLEFRLSLYDFAAEPASVSGYTLPQAPSHIMGGILAAPDNRSFYFLLRPGSFSSDPTTSYGLWRFDAPSASFTQVAGLSDPALHLVSLEPDGEWLLAQSESGQPLYIHLPTGTAYPFDLDGSRAALLVRRPQPEEIEPPIPQALPEASPTPGLPASLESFDLLGQAGGNLSAVALDGERAGIYVLGLR